MAPALREALKRGRSTAGGLQVALGLAAALGTGEDEARGAVTETVRTLLAQGLVEPAPPSPAAS